MSGLGEYDMAFQNAGGQITPNELDRYEHFAFINVGTSDVWFGTVNSATANSPFVMDNILPDYPRNLLFTVLGVAGGMGGTAVVSGYNRWGEAITETFAIGSANGGGTVAGTRIFARVTGGSMTPVGLGGTAVGTAKLGYAIGTSATTKFWLGLPTKIAGTGDVKMMSWVKNFVPTTLNGGTLTSTYINGTYSAISGSSIIGSAETYKVMFKPTWNNLNKTNLAAL